jgi:hypothetical protein
MKINKRDNKEKTLDEALNDIEEVENLDDIAGEGEEPTINLDDLLELENELEGLGSDSFNFNESENSKQAEVRIGNEREEPLTKEENVTVAKKDKPKVSVMKFPNKKEKVEELNLEEVLDETLLNVNEDEEESEVTLDDIHAALHDPKHEYHTVKWYEKGLNIGVVSVVTVLLIAVGYQFGLGEQIKEGYQHMQLIVGNANVGGRAEELKEEAMNETGLQGSETTGSESSSGEIVANETDTAVLELTPEEEAMMLAAEEEARLLAEQYAEIEAEAASAEVDQTTGMVSPGRYIVGQSLAAGTYYAGTGSYTIWNSMAEVQMNVDPSVIYVSLYKEVVLAEGQVLQFTAGTLADSENRPSRQVTTLTAGDDYIVGKDLAAGEYEIVNVQGRENKVKLQIVPIKEEDYRITVNEKTYAAFKVGDKLTADKELLIYLAK